MTKDQGEYCSQCGQAAVRGQVRCGRCGARVRSAVVPGVLLILLACLLAMIFVSARYYVPAFLFTLRYLNDVFAVRPRFTGLEALLVFDGLYVKYLFWPLLAATLGGFAYLLTTAKNRGIRPAAGWREGLVVLLVGGAALGATALQFVVPRTYFFVLPDVVTLLPDHLAFRAERLEQAGQLERAEELFERAVRTIPSYQEKRIQEMRQLYEAFQERVRTKKAQGGPPGGPQKNGSRPAVP